MLLFASDFVEFFGDFLIGVGGVTFLAATVLTVWSGIAYVVNNKQVLKDA